jgi:glycosyltransferase involved in cell wall biosynthesis
MREAAKELGLELTVMGRDLEEPGFWDGVSTRRVDADWLDGASVVVLPAYIEHKPRRLLEAIACGIPVIATPSCGLGQREGVITVPAGDSDTLIKAIEGILQADEVRV